MAELLLGCGFSRAKLLGLPGEPLEWQDLVTLDHNEKCEPDILCDMDMRHHVWEGQPQTIKGLNILKGNYDVPLPADTFSEIHAYEVLEHLGRQGYAASFFDTFRNIHRLLAFGGHFFATCPSRHSPWAWGDPSHRRIISQESLCFLDQSVIKANRERGSQMSDFSDLWDLDFKVIASGDDHRTHSFCLQKR